MVFGSVPLGGAVEITLKSADSVAQIRALALSDWSPVARRKVARVKGVLA